MSMSEEPRPGLRPPRFGLKTMMWSMTLIAIFFALFSYLGSHVTAILILLALAVIAHVAGNALGTQLRANGDASPATQAGSASAARLRKVVVDREFAPATRLRHRLPLGKPILILTALGTVLGGLLGGFVFVFQMDRPVPIPNALLGVLSAAVLGGIWTFIAASFIQVAASAMWQAQRDSKNR